MRKASVLVLVLTAFGAGRSAHANGAFPDSQGVLLASDRPNDIMLATNFGVVMSQDNGQTWSYSCEQMTNGAIAAFYQIGPPPLDRLFAITDIALVYSDDHACTWKKAQGMLAGKAPADYFPDAANPNRVWAVRAGDTTAVGYTVVESLDGGATFNTVRFTSEVGDVISGVELARSDPNTAYLTLRSGTNFAPKLAVTKNGGASWDTRDLSTTAIGTGNVRLVSIDPTNPAKIFLRVQNPSGAAQGDGIALSLDGGMTFVTPPPINVPGGVLTSFTRLSDGTLLVAGVDVVRNVIFRSINGGTSFTELDAPIVRGLGQRDGRAFAASNDDVNDDTSYALGQSSDDGMTFQPLMRFEQVQAISACVKTMCQADCEAKVNLGTWSEDVCTADATPADAGTAADAGTTNHDAGGAGGHAGDAAADAPIAPIPTQTSGCSCDASGGAPINAGAGTALGPGLLLALAAWRRRRPRR